MRTVIFDLDGTLVDTAKDITASINFVRSECYGLPPLEKSRVVDLMNRPGLNLAYEFYGVERYEERAKMIFEEHYANQCLQNATQFDGVAAMLERLEAAGIKMFVATNAPTETSKIILEKNSIAHFFEDIVGADRVKNPKPHPEIIEKIVGARDRDLCWMVGDSPKDMIAANKAKIGSIFAGWGVASDILCEEHVGFKAQKPSEVIDYILNN